MTTGPLLECEGLSKRFGGVDAVDGVSLVVAREPQIVSIIGPNGAGKTTLFNLISGALPPTAGRVLFDGRQISGRPAHALRRLGISRTYQDVRVFPSLAAVENVAVASSAADPASRRWPRALERAAEALQDVGFTADPSASVDRLNLFERKQVDVARALVTRPRLLLLDEFLAGIGDSEIEVAVTLLGRLKDRGTVVVLIEHVMRAVMRISDRVVVLDHGKLIEDGSPLHVTRQQRVIDAYLGAGWRHGAPD